MPRERRAKIVGTGLAAPVKILTNFDLEKMVETSDEWITSRTGIKIRHIAENGTASSDLGIEASLRALQDARVEPDEIDLIMVATVTPDMFFPSTACLVQSRIGAKRAAAYDINAACSGFIYGLSVADSFIATGKYRTILLVAAECLSKVTDWEDRNTCVLFGDGAGAVVLKPSEGDCGVLATHLMSDGSLCDLLYMPAGGSRRPASQETVAQRLHFIKMSGNEVFKLAVRAMGDAAIQVLEQAGLSFEEVDLLIPHQANIRIIEAVAKRLDLPRASVYVNIDRYGNTSAASVPIALAEANQDGLLHPGDVVLLVAFGGGFTWGAAAIRW